MTRNLRARLTVLYPRETDARRVAADAGIPPERIVWGGSAEDVWFAVLAEAERLNLVEAVTRVATGEYPDVMRGNNALEALLAQRDARLAEDPGADVDELDEAILRMKRAVREGPHLHPGEYISDNRYRLLRKIGHGGFGTVWQAYDRVSRRHVAVKVLHSQWAQDTSRVERFDRGARAMERLRHPNIVRIERLREQENGFYYFVMEYVEGGTLRDAVADNRITKEKALRVVATIGDALAFAHESGVIHRDVKPANVLLRADGAGVLTDFDLVLLADSTGGTGTGALGTILYTAPEMLDQPHKVDQRVDVFSLAMTATFVLAGGDPPSDAYRNPASYVTTLDCKPSVRWAVRRALEWNPQHRLSTVREFCRALQAEDKHDTMLEQASYSILVVDDQPNMRRTFSIMLRAHGFKVDEAKGGDAAIEMLANQDYEIVITDLMMGDRGGLDVLRYVKDRSPRSEVIVMTAFGSIGSVVESMRLGAYDYLEKPFMENELVVKVQRALEKYALGARLELLTSEFRDRYRFENIVGRSPAIRQVLSRVTKLAPTDATVLITGESGTGKELIAKAIHANSARAHMPFVPINCAAMTETLLESEIFGHTRGAFAGAVRNRRGLVEEADGGTLFIEEVTETALPLQARLLRMLQEGEVRRVGDSRVMKVNVRVIAATSQDAWRAMAEKRFRQDLYYRLNVARFVLPPLRDRREDIPALVDHFLAKYCKKTGARVRLGDAVLDHLIGYDYPGNIRELENVIEQAAALASVSGIIQLEDVAQRDVPAALQNASYDRTLAAILDASERAAIESALREHEGSRDRAAEQLGLSPTTLWRKMKRLNID